MPLEITLSIIFFCFIVVLYLLSFFLSKKTSAESIEIIEQASESATEIMTQAELSSIEISVQERILLKESLKSFEFQLNKLRSEISDGSKKEGDKGIELFNTGLTSSLDEYQKQLAKSVAGFQDSLSTLHQNQINQTLSETTKEIEEYKKNQLQLFNENILKILEKTILDASSQIISVDQHRDIIFGCFEKAKKEGLFNK